MISMQQKLAAMTRYILLSTVRDRLFFMDPLMESIRLYLPDWKIIVVAQAYSEEDNLFLQQKSPYADIILVPEKIGPHNAKILGFQRIIELQGKDDNYVVLSIDDDMEFLPQTNIEPMIIFSMNPLAGMIQAGWVHHESLLAKRGVSHTFIEQKIIYTGGGLLLTKKTIDIVLKMPLGNYWDDNSEWSLAVYMAGYSNYRYIGSLTIHRVCRKGGRRGWTKEITPANWVMPNPDYLKIEKMKIGDDFRIGHQGNLKPIVKETHTKNKIKLIEVLQRELTDGDTEYPIKPD